MDIADLTKHIDEEVDVTADSGWTLTVCCALVLSVYFVTVWALKVSSGRCRSSADLAGKVAVVTGANQGIGYHTAYDLAVRNARVILACRNTEKGEEAARHIRRETKNQNIVVKKLDLSSLKSVRDFTADIIQNEHRLDILVNNAGVVDLMKKSAPARIVNLTSIVHSWGKIEFDNLLSERQFKRYFLYFDTKLANVLFTRELSKRLKDTGVTANCVNPGTVQTNLLGEFNMVFKVIFYGIGYLFFKTPEDGAQTSIYCAVSEEMEGITGKYFSECEVAKEGNAAKDDAVARKLWEASEKLTGLKPTLH